MENYRIIWKTGPKLIDDIDFLDIKVDVYYDKYTNEDVCNSVWQMRNPDSCYQGIMYMDLSTGKIRYPKDAVIPKQTKKDREMLPKFIIIGKEKLEKKDKQNILKYFKKQYKYKNKIIGEQLGNKQLDKDIESWNDGGCSLGESYKEMT